MSKPFEAIKSPAVKERILQRVDEIGQYAAVSYAQRVIGQRETGAFTFENVELVNAANPEHFLMCYQHLCQAHLSREGKSPVVTMADYTDTGIPVEQKPTPTEGIIQKGPVK